MGDLLDKSSLDSSFMACDEGNPFERDLQDSADEFFEDDEEIFQEDSDKQKEYSSNADEDQKRAEHEKAEEKRRLEWEAKQQEKRKAEKEQLARIAAMSEEELVAASAERIGKDTEKLTRRNMKECVSEYIQTLCFEDVEFARLTMQPKKNMVRCFQYINRKAYEYVQDEMKVNGMRNGGGMQCYASDIPDDLCYHWAEEYFRTANVKEDEEKEEKFIPKAYKAASGTKTNTKKPTKKKTEQKQEKKAEGDGGQMSFLNQLSLPGMEKMEEKAG
mgnify:CR=1 FL=1|nr:Cas9 inhibitor AcrIIA9 family protein [uncultured Blautia sp.]